MFCREDRSTRPLRSAPRRLVRALGSSVVICSICVFCDAFRAVEVPNRNGKSLSVLADIPQSTLPYTNLLPGDIESFSLCCVVSKRKYNYFDLMKTAWKKTSKILVPSFLELNFEKKERLLKTAHFSLRGGRSWISQSAVLRSLHHSRRLAESD